jgi:hypothetical protein
MRSERVGYRFQAFVLCFRYTPPPNKNGVWALLHHRYRQAGARQKTG